MHFVCFFFGAQSHHLKIRKRCAGYLPSFLQKKIVGEWKHTMVRMKMQPFEGESEQPEGKSVQPEDSKKVTSAIVAGAVILTIIMALILVFVMRRKHRA